MLKSFMQGHEWLRCNVSMLLMLLYLMRDCSRAGSPYKGTLITCMIRCPHRLAECCTSPLASIYWYLITPNLLCHAHIVALFCADIAFGVADAGAAQCNVCLPGSFSASAKASTCNECPRGTFQNKYGQQECLPCKEGTYQDARASAKCKVCPTGTFNPEKGSVSQQACM